MDVTTRKVNHEWILFTLTNNHGMEVQCLNYGGIITRVSVPDKNHHFKNVVLGYDDYKDYESDPNFFGAIIGPVAGRIKDAEIILNGQKITLEKNEGNQHLHSGSNGLHKTIWDSQTFKNNKEAGVILNCERKNGQDGYPGNVKISVTYTLTETNELLIDYCAVTDQATPLTLTNHSYFNLTGNKNLSVADHFIQADSHQFLELDDKLLPTGKIVEPPYVPFDLKSNRRLHEGISAETEQNRIVGNGYDHYFLFAHETKENVVVKEKTSGRVMRILTDQPGMVLYTGQNITTNSTSTSRELKKYTGVCFETQGSPASLYCNELPSIILYPEETYKKQTIFAFSIEE